MLENISKVMRDDMPVASAMFYGAATLVVGRRFCKAAVEKVCAAAARIMGSESAAEWNKVSDESLSLAKKNVKRDVAAVAGFIGLFAIALGTAETYLLEDEKEKTWSDSIRDNLHYVIGTYVIGSGLFVGLLKYKMSRGKIGRKYQQTQQYSPHSQNSNQESYYYDPRALSRGVSPQDLAKHLTSTGF